MKLIQINDTLYIVEGENKYKVSEESLLALVEHARYNYIGNLGHLHPSWHTDIVNGVDITDIKHRIEINNYKIIDGLMVWKQEAVLVPEKEDTIESLKLEPSEQLYSIELIEKAIEEAIMLDKPFIKKQIINNLTK